MFQLTAARRRLGYWDVGSLPAIPFQLTAARRRLAYDPLNLDFLADVSTHSRAKAAGNLAQGRPDVSPETPVTVAGFKVEIDAEKWLIKRITHTLNDGGYTAALELEALLDLDKSAAETEKAPAA